MTHDHDIEIDALPQSHDCPACGEVAFMVVIPPVLQCLHCGSRWRFLGPCYNPLTTISGARRAGDHRLRAMIRGE